MAGLSDFQKTVVFCQALYTERVPVSRRIDVAERVKKGEKTVFLAENKRSGRGKKKACKLLICRLLCGVWTIEDSNL